MKLVNVRIDGFGRLVGRRFLFGPRVNVIVGPNEAGKSTLATAIVATLYGPARRDDREAWRPWSGARYAVTLEYELEDGRGFEIQRDFDREPKGVRVFDESGTDVSQLLAIGKNVNPGVAHLGVPLEVFASASCVAQGQVEIDGARAERISAALAQALDGGPREDAALGALERLDGARRRHVGTDRATVNAPLKKLREEAEDASVRADEARAAMHALEETRGRLRHETHLAAELDAALVEHERRGRALRAHTLRSRLAQLRELRDDLASLQSDRAQFDDEIESVTSSARASELERRFHEYRAAETLAADAAAESERARLTPAVLAELDERARDGGALTDAEFATLEAAAASAAEARAKTTYASNAVQAARRTLTGGGDVTGGLVTAYAIAFVATAALAAFRFWTDAAVVGALTLVLGSIAYGRVRARSVANATLRTMQRAADLAIAEEQRASASVARTLEPLRVASIEALATYRARYRELLAASERDARARERAERARTSAGDAAAGFDALATMLVPERGATRAEDLALAKARDARRAARDGIDMQLSFLDVRRNDVLGDDDDFALERELDDLLAAGVVPAPLEAAPSLRAFEAERADLERRASDARVAAASSAAELRTSEATVANVASLDEEVDRLRARVAALEAFAAAVDLARSTIAERTQEAHQRFARRLADYSSETMEVVTAGRYTELRVDPTTLQLHARVPETGAFENIDRLSAGTREQASLVVRLAMVRMFSEGLERPPLVLDDPFAYWDDERIARGLPILDVAAADAQVLLFTTSAALADAAVAAGAHRIDLDSANLAALGD